ncbi:GNAT family N-acetyltransferase [Lysinibacillus sp. FSL W8-0992]|uniref:GNAT family N-acetyltransferase n=1 Tax=Lysinibacillus sp. FSL W8-0992 TaxID=2954643 RepID=UPI0030F64468
MIVSIEKAIQVFELLPKDLQSYYMNPTYIAKDSLNNQKLKVCFFVIHQENNIFYHAFYLGNVLDTNLRDILTPYGYGGPIIFGTKIFKEKAINSYKDWCKENKVLAEFIRFHPLANTTESYYGNLLFNRETVYIDLENPGDLIGGFSTRVRTAVKKAYKNNLKVIFSKEPIYLEAFINLYNDLMLNKQAGSDYFFKAEYYKELLKSDHTFLLSVIDTDGEIVASSICFMTDYIAEYHLSASTIKGRNLCATNIIIYEFAKFAKENNVKNFYLGGGTDSSTENSLLFFKKGFSALSKGFYIGSYIHDPINYKDLKTKIGDFDNKKILFYR